MLSRFKLKKAGCPFLQRDLAFLSIRILVFCLIFSSVVKGQAYRSVRISLAEGLSQSTVYSIAQDSPGFLWVATQDGLNKYDGISFETFYNQPFDSSSIPSANIASLFCDSKNRLWIGTMSAGLSLYNKKNKSFRNFSHSSTKGSINDNSVYSICEDKSGTIWIGTSAGLNRMNESKTSDGKDSISFESVNAGNDSLLQSASVVFPDGTGVLWVGTKNGLIRLETISNGDQQRNSVRVFSRSDGIPDRKVQGIIKDQSGRLLVVTVNGISVYDASQEKFSTFSLVPDDGKKVMVNCAALFSDNSVWLGCVDGVYKMYTDNINSEKKSVRIEKIISKNSDTQFAVISLAEDRINKGIAWAGSEANGLTRIVPVTKNFHSYDLKSVLAVPFVYSLLEDSAYLWIGTTSGLIRKNIRTNQEMLLTVEKSTDFIKSGNYIYHLRKDEYGNLWAGTLIGLFKIEDPYSAHPQFRKMIINKDFPDVGIRDLYPADKKRMYVVLPRKLFLFDVINNESELIMDLDRIIIDNKAIQSSVAKDTKGNLFVGTSDGLIVFSNDNGKMDFSRPFYIRHNSDDTASIRCDNIYNLTADPDGSVWIATANGLSNLNLKKNTNYVLSNYSIKNGLKNNAIYTILIDSSGNSVWFSTNGGLTKYDKLSRRFYNYDLHDGLQSNEFNAGAGYISTRNELFFGGVNGYTSFFPDEIKTDSVKPQLAITKFQILGKEREETLNDDNKFELKYFDNSFSIEFVALQFSNPRKNRYKYMLEGYQKEWIDLGTANKVIFSNLPPGEFVFRVIGSNEDRVFNSIGKTLVICIRPPFYKTIWFYLALALLVGSVLWLMHVYRLRFKMKQVATVEKIRTETAADFHDELGHKLTTISWFSEIMKRKLYPEQTELKEYLDKITNTTGALYHTMHDLLWAMDPEKDSLFDLYKQLREFGESLFDQTEFRFISMENNNAFKNDTIPFEQKRHVLLIFKEVMNNSFKHSKASIVSLNAYRENNHYTLIVKDDGSGIRADESNYGNGLKNVYKRSDFINGELKIFSDRSGTTIELSVPLTN